MPGWKWKVRTFTEKQLTATVALTSAPRGGHSVMRKSHYIWLHLGAIMEHQKYSSKIHLLILVALQLKRNWSRWSWSSCDLASWLLWKMSQWRREKMSPSTARLLANHCPPSGGKYLHDQDQACIGTLPSRLCFCICLPCSQSSSQSVRATTAISRLFTLWLCRADFLYLSPLVSELLNTGEFVLFSCF